jgi:uncharacterized protein YjbI with pentapeptide repeats
MVTHDSDALVCECEDHMRSACHNEVFYKEYDGKRFCVLHYPGKDKSQEFRVALQRKLTNQDFDFRGVWFPYPFAGHKQTFSGAICFAEAHFSEALQFRDLTFEQKIDFSKATFGSTAEFKRVAFKGDSNFSDCRFSDMVEFDEIKFNFGQFSKATFNSRVTFQACLSEEGTNFSNAVFSGKASFKKSTFKSLNHFYSAEFNKPVEFEDITFAGSISFMGTTFKDYVRFANGNHSVDFAGNFSSFAHAKFEKPERVTFDTLRLSPSWFRNVDVRKFEFINIMWMDLYDLYDKTRKPIPDEIALISRSQAVTYRQLASNAEENHRYEEASNFRNMAMDAKRLELRDHWRKNFFKPSWWKRNVNVLHLLYWAASGYGEKIWRATKVLIGIWLLFTVIYASGDETWWKFNQSTSTQANQTGPDSNSRVTRSMELSDALIYSAAVMMLQKPEPLPANKRAKVFVLIETVLGPVQLALLALAIRRKFMR